MASFGTTLLNGLKTSPAKVIYDKAKSAANSYVDFSQSAINGAKKLINEIPSGVNQATSQVVNPIGSTMNRLISAAASPKPATPALSTPPANSTTLNPAAPGDAKVFPAPTTFSPPVVPQVLAPAPSVVGPGISGTPAIPFIAGLSDSQKSSILSLSQNKPSDQWTATDLKNWNYATNNAPLPQAKTQSNTNTSPANPSLPDQARSTPVPENPAPAPSSATRAAPINPAIEEAQKLQKDAETLYQKNLQASQDELATQGDLDRLSEQAKDLGERTRNQPIPLEFVTGQLASIERMANMRAETLQTRLARLQAQRTAALNASQFALQRADQRLKDEQARADNQNKPIEVGGSLVRMNPATGRYESVFTAPGKDAEGFTLSEGQSRYDSKGNLVASTGPKSESAGNYEVVQDQKTGAFYRINKLTGQAEPIMAGGANGNTSFANTGTGNGSGSGSISFRTNNPGNIKFGDFARSLGAVDSGIRASDGGTFAQFPSLEAGTQAQFRLLQSPSYANLTVDAAMRRWSNNGYGADVTGGAISPNRLMSSLSQQELNTLQKAMQKREGFVAGSATPFATSPKDGTQDPQARMTKAQEVLSVARSLLNDPKLNSAVGPISSMLPTVRGETADFEANVNRLKSLLTLENLGLLKGAMSDKDLELLQSAASSLSTKMSEQGFRNELNSIINKMSGIVAGGTQGTDTGSNIDASSIRAQYNY